jgi:hypothetical protein
MMLMMQNFASKPKMSCSTITAVVMMMGFLWRDKNFILL